MINADGSLEPFTAVSGVSLAAARYGHTTTIVGNKLYIIGGAGNGGTLRDVEQATINADGSIGAFAPAAGVTLSAARTTHSTMVLGKALYVIGGVGASGSLTSVERADFNDDGSLKAFAPATGVTLTSARRGHAAVVLGNYFYIFGGAGTSNLNSVERASINISGALEALIPAPGVMFTFPHEKPAMVVVGNYFYAIGGQTIPAGKSIERSTISADGTLAPFVVVPDVATVASYGKHTSAVIGNHIYIIGGDNVDSALDTVESAPINPDGSLGSFAIVPGVTLRTARSEHTSAIIGNYLYIFGGLGNSGGARIPLNSTERAPISADGTLQTFAAVSNNSLTTVRSGHAMAVVGTYIYLIGGSGAPPRSLERSTIQADGSIGPFSPITGVSFAIDRFEPSVAITGPYLNIFGGTGLGSGTEANAVERSNTNADGTLGSFMTFGTAIPVFRSYHTSPMLGNYVYIAGGIFKTIDWLQLK